VSAAERTERITAALNAARAMGRPPAPDGAKWIRLCAGTSCHASGRLKVRAALQEELAARGLQDSVRIVETGCPGFCQQGPVLVVEPAGTFYPKVKPESAAAIVEGSIVGDEPLEKLLYKDPYTGERVAREADVPFYAGQTRVVMELNGRIDPYSIDDYLDNGGYTALAKVLAGDDPEGVIDETEAAKLRGRGGGGFLTGRKWRACRANPGEARYVIANGDEGDPGAFMDRSLLEGNPHLVLEGMLIAAFAIGAGEGYVYTRREYPFAIERVGVGLEQARERGLLGDDILGSGFSCDLRLAQGMGALVCGEATALVKTIEGRRSEPTGDMVRLVERGLWGLPTNVNNVETYANVAWIVNHGAEAYAGLGEGRGAGTKIYAISGNVKSTGLIEVPVGTSPQHIIDDIAGGMIKGREVKAVQFGGAAGGCIPADAVAQPAGYDDLAERGLVMCSGGMIVIDDQTCMVEFARSSLAFTSQESCGKCVPCRLGSVRLKETLDRIVEGEGRPDDIELLEELADYMKEGTICALGGSAPTPLTTALTFYRHEFEAHVHDKTCPAGQCKPLISYYIDAEACTGCGLCAKKCPTGAITGERKQAHFLDVATCIKCDSCRQACRFDAVRVRPAIQALSTIGGGPAASFPGAGGDGEGAQ